MASGENPTDPKRLREGIEKYERAAATHGDWGLRQQANFKAYERHAYNDYPALARLIEQLRIDYELAYERAGWSDETGCPVCGNRSVAHYCPPREKARQRIRAALAASSGASGGSGGGADGAE